VSHMVIFQTPDGSPGYNQFGSLAEAVAFVEDLRNRRDITNARMFALEEIKFELKPYFKVELPALNAGPGASAPAASAPPAADTPQPAVSSEDHGSGAAASPAPPAAAAPAAPTFGTSSPEPTPAPAAAPPPPATPAASEPAPAAAPSAQPEQGGGQEQPARRGLFGR